MVRKGWVPAVLALLEAYGRPGSPSVIAALAYNKHGALFKAARAGGKSSDVIMGDLLNYYGPQGGESLVAGLAIEQHHLLRASVVKYQSLFKRVLSFYGDSDGSAAETA